MKKDKRLLSVFLVCCLLAIFLPTMVLAVDIVDSGTCGSNLTWTLDGNGTLTISGSGEMNDYYNYSSDRPWNQYLQNIKTVIIKDGVTTVGAYAFYYCKSLSDISLPDSVTSIGGSAFADCSNLNEVLIPEKVTNIDIGAFSRCTGLTKLTFPATAVVANPFDSCYALTDITLTGSGNMIEYSSTERPWYISLSDVSVTIEKGVTSISNNAFDYCDNLYSISIPDSVTSIGEYAFRQCYGLTQITIPDSVTRLGKGAFQSCKNLIDLTLSNKNRLESIEDFTFNGCEKLSGIVIPQSVKSVGRSAFSGCSNLTSVQIPDGVLTIGEVAFQFTGIKEIHIPDTVTSIGASAFSDCSNATELYIGTSVDYIGNNAFHGCDNLEVITYNATNATGVSRYSLDLGTYTMNDGIDVIFRDDVQIIPNDLFFNNTFVDSIIIGENVTSIGDKAFYSTNLVEVRIPEKVSRIGENAFSHCTQLAVISMGENVTSIGAGAFSSCRNLTSVIIPNGVTNIDRLTFYDCSRLTNITIPASITSIAGDAFSGCSGLADVYYIGGESEWNNISIADGTFNYATVHYNSTGPSDTETANSSVQFFSRWDSNTNQAFFDNSLLAYSVTENTDISSVSSIDQLVGKYVLVEMDQTNVLEVASIKPVDSKIGVVRDVTTGITVTGNPAGTSLRFDDGTYPVADGLTVNDGLAGKTLVYHLYSDEICGFEVLEEKTGTLDGWYADAGLVTIGGTEYPTNYLTDLTFLANLDQILGKQVSFYVTPSEGYTCVMKIDSFQTGTGVFSHYDPLSDSVFIGGEEYPVDSSVCAPDNNALKDKDVFFLLKGGSIVHIDTFDKLTTGLQITLRPMKFTVNYQNGAYDKDNIQVKVIVTNRIDYDFPDGYDTAVIFSSPAFQADTKQIALTGAVWQTADGPEFVEDGEIGTQNKVLGVGEQVAATANIALKASYIPEDKSESALVTFTISGSQAGQPTSAQENIIVEITNLDYGASGGDIPSDSIIDTLTEKASKELSKVDSVIGLNMNTMEEVFGIKGKALTRLEQELLSVIVMSNAPQQRFEDQVAEAVLEKAFGKFKPSMSAAAYVIPLRYVLQTPKYGQVTVQFNCDMINFIYTGTKLGLYGTISYEILDSDKNVPSIWKAGTLGQIVQADVSAFASAAYDVAEAEIKRAYDMVWGGPANELADLLFDQTIKDILDRHDTTFKDEVWNLVTWPTKNIINRCPTNVYIYDETGTLCGAIEDNIVTKSNGDFALLVEGTTKYINNLEDRYTVKYVATDNGTMDVVVTEYIGYETPLRQVAHYEIPLSAGGYYTQNISSNMQPPLEEYQLVSDSEVIFPVDEESKLLELKPAEEQESETPSNPPVSPSTPGQSGSDSSGGSSPNYSITAPTEVENGSIAVSPKRAEKGDTVTITVNPDEGYEVKELAVLDKSGDTVKLTKKSESQYTFTMPGSKVEILVVFSLIEEAEPEEVVLPFTDVARGAWYYDAVSYVYANGLMQGTGQTLFSPDRTTTRGMIATILYRLEKEPTAGAVSFSDVSEGQYYTEAVAWASQNGIVNGYGNHRFGPDDPITREQLAVMLWRYSGSPATAVSDLNFMDAGENSNWALEALCWAVENGIVSGKSGGILDPQGRATRAEVAQMLKNYMD